MCFGGPSPPDPYATAQAQQGVNKDALMTAAQLNQINQTGPFGNIKYSGDIGSPDRTQTTSLDPALQKILGGQEQSTQSLTDLANSRLAGAPNSNFELGNNPAGYIDPAMGQNLQTSVPTSTDFTTGVNARPLQYGFQQGQQVQGQVNGPGTGTNAQQQAQDANYALQTQYLDPQFKQSDQQLASQLAAQGITQGSDAYNQAMDNAARQKQSAYSDARNSAIGAGNAEQNTMYGQALSSGNFANAAANQEFAQNQGQAGFYNQTQNQAFGQGATNAGLNNQAQNDTFNQNLAAGQFGNSAISNQLQNALATGTYNQGLYQQNLGNQITGRNQNINEAMAYLNGAPISPSQPTFQPIAQSTAAQAAPDLIGLAGSNYANQLKSSSSGLGSIFGAAGQIGSAAIMCWVAREVYGETNPEWLAFREWMLNLAPKWLLRAYLKHGERFAAWIHDKPLLKKMIRAWMSARINATA